MTVVLPLHAEDKADADGDEYANPEFDVARYRCVRRSLAAAATASWLVLAAGLVR